MRIAHSNGAFGLLFRVVKLFLKSVLFFYVPLGIATLLYFPYDTDPANSLDSEVHHSATYYEAAYRVDRATKRGIDYELTAKKAADSAGIEKQVRRFVADFGLENKKILEIGSGRGYLQDVVSDYTGLDLSASVAGNYHKPFIVASATSIPFPASSFDGIWSVWVVEHIPEPEKALLEIRRVLKPGGLLFLYVGWNCTARAADGFAVRPYTDFNWRGKLVKASLPLERFARSLSLFSTRLIRRSQHALGKATRLHFIALDPNYETYWESDSDAAVSLDSFETYLWFSHHGDECLNCLSPAQEWAKTRNPLIIRIRK